LGNPHILLIEHKGDKGFKHIYDLVDRFHYKNLGRKGKKFSIVKHTSIPSRLCNVKKIKSKQKPKKNKINIDALIVRDFRKGDEEGIARLIYKNYGLSYVKDDFYYPSKILEGEGKKFVSIITEANNKVVGHFALELMPDQYK